jgi:hypothetical protein
MKVSIGRVAAAGAVVGLLGLGGIGYAYAQSSDTSPATTAPGSAPSNNGGDHSTANCPNMGGSSGGSANASQTRYMMR